MNKKVGVVGTFGHIDGCSFMNTDKLLNRVGGNTGNLLFQYAVCKSINEEVYLIGDNISWDINTVRDNCRVIVIPSANFIRENFDLSGFVDFLEQLDLPLVFLGLGAQAKDYEQKEFDFHPSILKLIKLIKERSKTIGLRGEFTANLLEKYGVKNTVITGCPTNFLNSDPNLSEKLKTKWDNPVHSFLATGDEPWPKNQKKRDAERKMIDWVHKGNGIFIQQSVIPFIKYARQNNPYQNAEVPEHHEEALRKSIAPNMTNTEFKAFIATKLRIYYNVDQWLEDSSRFDFSIGLRLHGNMAAWQSGTPAIWVYHDARTRELVETMALPHMGYLDFLQLNSIEEMKESIDFCFSSYSDKRKLLFSNYTKILQEENIGFYS